MREKSVRCFKLEKENKKYEYEMCGVKLKSVQCAPDLGVKIAINLKFSQQCNDAANKENKMLDFLKKKSYKRGM